ncbi:MAG: hypothetical protein WC699_10435 [Bacteroidales bacterium]|jgi:predicted house-cleaning NTP pyrophosphatase (Maf/HAM1 superfamily)
MAQKNRTKIRTGIQLSCFVVFNLCFHLGYAQTISENIKQEVIQYVSKAKYEKAITTLENNSHIIGNDTTVLFDIDGILGMKELKNRILHFNSKHGFFTISK